MRSHVLLALLAVAVPTLAHAEARLLRAPALIPERSRPFPWTQEEILNQISGRGQVRCELTDSGTPHDCRVLTGIAHVRDEELVRFAEGLRFTPAIGKDGLPVALADFRFPVRLVPPRVPELPRRF